MAQPVTQHTPDDKPTWFVLRHLEMDRFKRWLDTVNAERLAASEDATVIEPFYPYDYLRPGLAQDREKRQTQEEFRDLVFLRGLPSEIDALVNDPFNKDFRVNLHYLIDPLTQQPARVLEHNMDTFLTSCIKFRGRFELVPAYDDIQANDRVRIVSGPFAGREAFVVKVRQSKGDLCLDLAIELVTGVMSINMKGVRLSQVMFLDKDPVGAIRKDFIDYIQKKVLTVFEHRVKPVNDKETRLRDMTLLNNLYRYHSYVVEGRAALAHFKALMLISAHLRKDREGEAALRQEVEQLLADIDARKPSKAATDTRAWLWIALYISTADPAYRDLAKAYVRDEAPKSASLIHFVRLMRKGKKV